MTDQFEEERLKQENSVPATDAFSAISKRNFMYGFFGFLGVALVLSLLVGVYRVYAKSAIDPFTVTVAKVLRLPAAKVNGSTALYSDYADDLRAITTMRDYDKSTNGPAAVLTNEELSDQVLYRLVNNILVNNLAKKYDLKAEKSDIEAVKTNILEKEFQSIDKAEEAIKNRYGWTMEQFEKKVIKPFVLQGKLTEKIKSDAAAVENIQKKAEGVLSEIKGGASFEDMAQKYGEDSTAQKGGDLGWFGKGEMVPEFETAAFALKKGELSAVLVQSQFGFHIIKVDDKKTDKVKNEAGKLVDKELVKARHILFMLPTLEQQLNNDIKTAEIKIYPKINNPFKNLNVE